MEIYFMRLFKVFKNIFSMPVFLLGMMFILPLNSYAYGYVFYCNRAEERFKSGDYESAIDNLDQAIKINPNSSRAYVHRGNSKFFLQDYLGSIEDYTKSIVIDPTSTTNGAYFNRGLAKEQLGNRAGACTDWMKAAKLGDEKGKRVFGEQCE